MLQHAHDCHTIQVFEKIVEVKEQVKSQNQQLHADLEHKSDLIDKLSDTLACVEKFIRSGVEIPDFVEANSAKNTATPASAWKQTYRPQFHILCL